MMFKFISSILLVILSAYNTFGAGNSDDKISSALKNDYRDIQININEDRQYPLPTSVTPTPFYSLKENGNNKPDVQHVNNGPQIKVEAYNTHSEKPVGSVAQAAITNSNSIIDCSQAGTGCNPALVTPTPKPVPTDLPKPTPSPVPEPTIFPLPTPFCKYGSEMPCRMIECPDLETGSIQNICGCPCVPPPIY